MAKKVAKEFTSLSSTDEFIEYYDGASKSELKARLQTIEKKGNFQSVKNEIRAIKYLLL